MRPEDGDVSEYEKRRLEKLNTCWQQMQFHVNVVMDSSRATGKDALNITPGIRQLLERKEGLFRMHMMGKRVNYSARYTPCPS